MKPATRSLRRLGANLALAGLLAACASPPPPPPPVVKAPTNYVVLLPDADGVVGRVFVKGAEGEQTLSSAGQGTAINGGGTPYVVPPAQLQRDFGAAMAARPEYPDHFYLYFESGGAKLTTESQAMIATILDKVKARANPDVSVVGHTDTAGKSEANAALAYQRATAIAKLLRDRGMQAASLNIESHGESNLLVPTPDETPEPRNRRVEITIR